VESTSRSIGGGDGAGGRADRVVRLLCAAALLAGTLCAIPSAAGARLEETPVATADTAGSGAPAGARAEHDLPLPDGEVDPAAALPDRAGSTGAAGSALVASEVTAFEATDELDLEIEQQPASFPDPFEAWNRRTFSFNRRVDRWVISPVARTYGAVVPDVAKSGVRNFLSNLGAPVRLLNDLLQARWQDAGTTMWRFGVNTLAGFAGLVDTAAHLGIPAHDADFGGTLAASGVGSGPFLIVPVFGPTTLRDGVGSIVDTAVNPALYLTVGVSPFLAATIGTGAEGIADREVHDRDLQRLEQGSVDFYAVLRSAYYQNRVAELGESATSEPAS
jgi:phospholipid-binding lipoprotein MlaA